MIRRPRQRRLAARLSATRGSVTAEYILLSGLVALGVVAGLLSFSEGPVQGALHAAGQRLTCFVTGASNCGGTSPPAPRNAAPPLHSEAEEIQRVEGGLEMDAERLEVDGVGVTELDPAAFSGMDRTETRSALIEAGIPPTQAALRAGAIYRANHPGLDGVQVADTSGAWARQALEAAQQGRPVPNPPTPASPPPPVQVVHPQPNVFASAFKRAGGNILAALATGVVFAAADYYFTPEVARLPEVEGDFSEYQLDASGAWLVDLDGNPVRRLSEHRLLGFSWGRQLFMNSDHELFYRDNNWTFRSHPVPPEAMLPGATAQDLIDAALAAQGKLNELTDSFVSAADSAPLPLAFPTRERLPAGDGYRISSPDGWWADYDESGNFLRGGFGGSAPLSWTGPEVTSGGDSAGNNGPSQSSTRGVENGDDQEENGTGAIARQAMQKLRAEWRLFGDFPDPGTTLDLVRQAVAHIEDADVRNQVGDRLLLWASDMGLDERALLDVLQRFKPTATGLRAPTGLSIAVGPARVIPDADRSGYWATNQEETAPDWVSIGGQQWDRRTGVVLDAERNPVPLSEEERFVTLVLANTEADRIHTQRLGIDGGLVDALRAKLPGVEVFTRTGGTFAVGLSSPTGSTGRQAAAEPEPDRVRADWGPWEYAGELESVQGALVQALRHVEDPEVRDRAARELVDWAVRLGLGPDGLKRALPHLEPVSGGLRAPTGLVFGTSSPTPFGVLPRPPPADSGAYATAGRERWDLESGSIFRRDGTPYPMDATDRFVAVVLANSDKLQMTMNHLGLARKKGWEFARKIASARSWVGWIGMFPRTPGFPEGDRALPKTRLTTIPEGHRVFLVGPYAYIYGREGAGLWDLTNREPVDVFFDEGVYGDNMRQLVGSLVEFGEIPRVLHSTGRAFRKAVPGFLLPSNRLMDAPLTPGQLNQPQPAMLPIDAPTQLVGEAHLVITDGPYKGWLFDRDTRLAVSQDVRGRLTVARLLPDRIRAEKSLGFRSPQELEELGLQGVFERHRLQPGLDGVGLASLGAFGSLGPYDANWSTGEVRIEGTSVRFTQELFDFLVTVDRASADLPRASASVFSGIHATARAAGLESPVVEMTQNKLRWALPPSADIPAVRHQWTTREGTRFFRRFGRLEMSHQGHVYFDDKRIAMELLEAQILSVLLHAPTVTKNSLRKQFALSQHRLSGMLTRINGRFEPGSFDQSGDRLLNIGDEDVSVDRDFLEGW